jgi:LppX_LprAFG lipoprotein
MLSRPNKVIVTCAAGAAAVLLAAGCGSGGTHPAARALSPQQAITLAANQAKQVNSFGVRMSITMSGTASVTMSGTAHVRIRPSLLADADFSKIDAAGQSLPGGMHEILTHRSIYLKMAPLSQQLHKPWAKISFSELQQGTGVNLSQLTQQVQNSNPLMQTQMLAAAKDVRAVGKQTIDGISTTHYTGTYSLSAGLAKLPASQRAVAQKGLQTLGVKNVRFNVWIDGQHQTRKIVVSETGSMENMTMTMQVTGINQPVSVTPPPASQVATIPASALHG